MEIERKFLVKDINAINEIISKYPKKTITQDYLYVDDYTAVRKRKIEKSGNTKYVYTVKTGCFASAFCVIVFTSPFGK